MPPQKRSQNCISNYFLIFSAKSFEGYSAKCLTTNKNIKMKANILSRRSQYSLKVTTVIFPTSKMMSEDENEKNTSEEIGTWIKISF